MRCVTCGWIVRSGPCPCGQGRPEREGQVIPIGTRVMARPGRGPSMLFWAPGEVVAHLATLHQVRMSQGEFWCEGDDLLPESTERESNLEEGDRVWARWLDGRWYPGRIDNTQGPLRHVTWDDGDAMWLETLQVVKLVKEGSPQVDTFVLAPRWDGEYQPARIEQQEGARFRVTFQDGEEAWVGKEELQAFPACPFLD